jgi:hypothetical protein
VYVRIIIPRQFDWQRRFPWSLQNLLSEDYGKNDAKSRVICFRQSAWEFTTYYHCSARCKRTNSRSTADAHSLSILKFRILLSDSSIAHLLKAGLPRLNV